MQAVPESIKANPKKNLEIDVDGIAYLRLPIKTDLVTEKDNLNSLIEKHLAKFLVPGDMIFISEKVVALMQGRIIKIVDIKPSHLARLLAGKVRNHYGTDKFRGFGHGTPMAMQLLLEEVGYPRILLATAISAITRPLGIKGAFYYICGKRGKSVDCPMSFDIHPYTMYAKMAPAQPNRVACEVKDRFGADAVILDANYRGVFSLGKSSRYIKESFIQKLFRDNPLGQADEFTPLCIVRRR